MLSATPFEYDYSDLYRQIDVFGFGGQQYLKIAGEQYSKNMYRREWRRGGYLVHDEPMALTDPRQRLVVGLMQKKVAEILGDRKFNNSFQIGMLSSFESFMESMARSRRLHVETNSDGEEESEDGENGEAVFDGRQEATAVEKRGIDSHSLEKVVSSYRDQFGHSLPHPKLDATATSLCQAFDTGDKALVFVRRVATVTELKAKLDEHYDRWIHRHMRQMLPDLHSELERIFLRYDQRTGTKTDHPEEVLLRDYLDLLDSQRLAEQSRVRFNAYHELSQAAEAFDTLVAVNFPEIRDARLSGIATIFGRTLQHQDPVGRMAGGVNKRMVKQFRMPGYPLVLATTDVLQEGEDLHTFCRRVIHYGITWTPSAMEQRTGRVDRIGSLVQRNLDGADRKPEADEWIQVYYPHLADTVERLQVRRVLERLNDFLRLVHHNVPSAASDGRLALRPSLRP